MERIWIAFHGSVCGHYTDYQQGNLFDAGEDVHHIQLENFLLAAEGSMTDIDHCRKASVSLTGYLWLKQTLIKSRPMDLRGVHLPPVRCSVTETMNLILKIAGIIMLLPN